MNNNNEKKLTKEELKKVDGGGLLTNMLKKLSKLSFDLANKIHDKIKK